MRIGVLVCALACVLGGYACGHTNAGTKAPTANVPAPEAAKISATTSFSASRTDSPQKATAPARVDFPTQIKPMLEARCQPCHFSGGKVYAKMPFDRPETIKTLGTKLFTRIKDENERRLISDFLAQE
jgi:hypothetical protein